MKPLSKEVEGEATRIREQIEEQVKSYSNEYADDTVLQRRLMWFKGVTIKPKVYFRTDAQAVNLIELLKDALGVFRSIHEDGVMPGGNTFFIKYGEILKGMYLDRLKTLFINYSSKKAGVYYKYGEILVDSLLNAYEYVYSFLDPSYEENVEKLKHDDEVKSDCLTCYNVVSGMWGNRILEASRSTRDIFIGAVEIATSLLMLKRITSMNFSENMTMATRTVEFGYHTINDQFVNYTIEKEG